MTNGIVRFSPALYAKLGQTPRNVGMEAVAQSTARLADRLERERTRRAQMGLYRERMKAEAERFQTEQEGVERRHAEDVFARREATASDAALERDRELRLRAVELRRAQEFDVSEAGRAARHAEDIAMRGREAATAEQRAETDAAREARSAKIAELQYGLDVRRNQIEGRKLELMEDEARAKTQREKNELHLRRLQLFRQTIDDERNSLAEAFAGIDELGGTTEEKAKARGSFRMGSVRHIMGMGDEIGIGDADEAAEQIVREAQARAPFLRLKLKAQAAMNPFAQAFGALMGGQTPATQKPAVLTPGGR